MPNQTKSSKSNRKRSKSDEEFEIQQEAFDREFCIVASLVSAALQAFSEMGERHGRKLPEMKIAEGLEEYIDEVVSGLCYSGEQQERYKLALQTVNSYLALARNMPVTPSPMHRARELARSAADSAAEAQETAT